jgi:cobalt-zinc-cadmium efflux system protein
MGDIKDHHEEHHHHHVHEITSLNKAFLIGIYLNTAFVLVEFAAGLLYNSMGLLSDAGHNLGDVASLALAMLAFRLAKIKPNAQYTYGYRKSTIVVSLCNAVLLLTAVIFIAFESFSKMFHPQPVEGGVIMWVAAVGVIINALTAFLFIGGKDKDINVKGAYLHMAADALVSVGVVVSGLIIMLTDCYWIDSVIGLVISILIAFSTWSLLRDSLRLSLDGVPMGIDTNNIISAMKSIPEVNDVHHVHIWGMSTTENAITAHIVIDDMTRMEDIKVTLKQLLKDKGISHATLEFESEMNKCKNCSSYSS